jgi:type IV pilus assembly protein PilB
VGAEEFAVPCLGNELPQSVAKPMPDAKPGWVEKAIAETPRRGFVSEEGRLDRVVLGRSIPSPNVVRRMLELLGGEPGMRLLHVGTGSGYVAAIASRIANQVISIERVPALVELARQRIEELDIGNVEVVEGYGEAGALESAPFDAILVSTSSLTTLEALLQQLRIGGRLVGIEGPNRHQQLLFRITRIGNDRFEREELGFIDFSREIGEILVEMSLVDSSDLERARRTANSNGTELLEELRRIVRLDDHDLYRALAEQHGIQFGEVRTLLHTLDTSLFEHVPRAFLDHNHLIPIRIENGLLRVATMNPSAPIEDLCKAFPGNEIELLLVTPTDFRRLWATLDLWIAGAGPSPTEIAAAEPSEDLLSKQPDAELEQRLVHLFEALILDAIGESASDIHLELYGGRVRVRLRVDGELRDLDSYTLTPLELAGLINVVKIRADLDIAERRMPQGGRLRLRAGGDVFDLRVQTQPSLHGEHAVIRLLPQSAKLISIEDLGFPQASARQYERLLGNPSGLVLVVGPTGSGKSTTLYAGLKLLAADGRRKVITVEDPIEYSIENIQQTSVRPEIGFCFADAMRSFVRQDPDVILVGEIRDSETAREAMRASQTGHVVLSTLHCNDAVDAVQRLFDLGARPNSIASELLAVIAQRLAKRICSGCRREVEPDPKIVAELFPDGVPTSFRTFAGRGCERCSDRGTHGRIAVIEYLEVTSAIRSAISAQPSVEELRRIALDAGLVTMRDSAVDHVTRGRIPLSELPRVLPKERMAPEWRD